MPAKNNSKKTKKRTLKSEIKEMRLHHKVATVLIATLGIVLLWRGLWAMIDLTPFVNNPVVSVVSGLLLLVISGHLLKLVK